MRLVEKMWYLQQDFVRQSTELQKRLEEEAKKEGILAS